MLVDARWREADFGDAEGRTFDELAVLEPDSPPSSRPATRRSTGPAARPRRPSATASASAWAALLADPGRLVIVSHAGPLRLAIALGTGSAPETVAFPAAGTAVRLSVPATAAGPGGPVADASRATLRR